MRSLRNNEYHRGWAALAVLALGGMALLRVLLPLGIPFLVRESGGYDDGLVLRLARELSEGRWLGQYQITTLIKGPFYPMFVAGAHAVGIPLPVAESLLWTITCGVAMAAIWPIVNRRLVLCIGFAVMLWNPYSWGELPARFSRDTIAGHLAVLLTAGLVGLIVRRGEGLGKIAAWGALTGMAGAAFWLTREEGIWLVGPGLLLLAGGVMVQWFKRTPRRNWRSAVLMGMPMLVGVLPVLGVCEMNRRHYGVFAVVELQTPEFEAAYGALSRVGEKFHKRLVPLPRAARLEIYQVSPAFALLRPQLEGDFGRFWADHGVPMEPREMQGGWFIWGFREAVSLAAPGARKAPAMAYYRQLAAEVNAACDQGLIPGGVKRRGMRPPLVSEDLGELGASLRAYGWRVFRWPDIRMGTAPMGVLESDLRLGAEMSGTRAFVPTLENGGRPRILQAWKRGLLAGADAVIRGVAPVLTALTLLWLGLAVWRGRQAHRWLFVAVLGTMFVAIGLRQGLLAYIDATSYYIRGTRYLIPTALMVSYAWVIAAAGACAGMKRRD